MNDNAPLCPICNQPLAVRSAHGRKSGKPFIMFLCPVDGRHFRGFISHRPYVEQFIEKLESVNKTEK